MFFTYILCVVFLLVILSFIGELNAEYFLLSLNNKRRTNKKIKKNQ
jgi:hypothetical protein